MEVALANVQFKTSVQIILHKLPSQIVNIHYNVQFENIHTNAFSYPSPSAPTPFLFQKHDPNCIMYH
jgi:hypothetical protein